MKLKNIRIRNFYSYSDVYIDFEKLSTGIVQLLGINKDTGGSNGAGKSILLEAVVFALFGKGIRKSTEEAMINVYEGGNCAVTLEIEQEGLGCLTITRKKRPTGLDVVMEGESQVKDNQLKTQEYLEELLDINYKSFCASVVFGQHSDIDFLSSSKEDKRLIIKNCLNLDTIFEYRNIIKSFKSDDSTNLKAVELLLKELNAQLKNLEDKNPNTKKYKFIEIPPLSDILAAEKGIREKEEFIKDANRKSRIVEDKIHKLEEIIVAGTSKESKECPICKSTYVKEQTQDDIDNAKINLEVLTKDLDDYSKQIKDWVEEMADLEPPISSSLWNKYNEKNKLCENSKVITEQIEALSASIKVNNDKRVELEKRLEVLKYWEKAFSEQGLLKYIIRNILDYLNLQINKFISILTNNQFSIIFDEELNETISTNNKIIQYISLSGGEKRKVNLAVMLGLQSIQSLLNKNNVNMIFFDEVSENIDPEGVQGIYNLLNTFRDEDKIIFLITHNEHLKSLLDSYQSITIIKANGISKIKED